MTLSKFVHYIEPNLIHLTNNNYLDKFITIIEVMVWNINLPSNQGIKLRRLHSSNTSSTLTKCTDINRGNAMLDDLIIFMESGIML